MDLRRLLSILPSTARPSPKHPHTLGEIAYSATRDPQLPFRAWRELSAEEWEMWERVGDAVYHEAVRRGVA